jgi:FkbM family methyltransferase
MSTPSDTRQEDRPFRHYSRKHWLVAWISTSLCNQVTYTVKHGLIQGMKRKGGLGWVPLVASHAGSPEEQFWRTLDFGGLVVYDIGAFEGILTMFFSARCARVISYEPNSRNHARLLENIRLNELNNITVRKLGLGARADVGDLVFMPLMAGGGTLEPKTAAQIRKSHKGVVSERIQITTLDQDIAEAGLPAPDFVKIDVEGFELEALKGASETLSVYHPALFLEMHGETPREKKRKVIEIVDWLTMADYTNMVHVETQTAITQANATIATEGHLYARISCGCGSGVHSPSRER